MPDICMCENEECPLKEKCYRHTAQPSEYLQSYARFEFVDGKCEYYYEARGVKAK